MTINEQLHDLVTRLAEEFNTHSSLRGNLEDLETTEKTSLVLALNEIFDKTALSGGNLTQNDAGWPAIPAYVNSDANQQALAFMMRFNQVDNTLSNHGGRISNLESNIEAVQIAAGNATAAANAANDAATNVLQITMIGAANGVAPLDAQSKIPSEFLPEGGGGGGDEVEFYDNFAAFPSTGQGDILYVAKDTGRSFVWSGSSYTSPPPAPTSTDDLTEGSSNRYFTAARVRSSALTGLTVPTPRAVTSTDTVLSSIGVVQAQINAGNNNLVNHTEDKDNPHEVSAEQLDLGNVDNTSDMDKPVSTLQAAAISDAVTPLNSRIEDLETWSEEIIDDSSTSLETTWSSNKIALEIGSGSGDVIDDESISSSTTWSSSYISSQLAETGEGPQQPSNWEAIEGPTRIVNKPEAFPPTAHTHDSEDITDASEFGRSLLAAEDAEEAKTLLEVEDSGIPPGGTTGQVLTKTSSTDYAVSWQTPSGGGGSGGTVAVPGSGALVLDGSLGSTFLCVLTGHISLNTPINLSDGQVIRLMLRQSGSAEWLIAGMSGEWRWPGGVRPVLSTGNEATDLIEGIYIANISAILATFHKGFAP